MRPLVFEQANGILKTRNSMSMDAIELGSEIERGVGDTSSMDENGVCDLPIYYDGQMVVSCFELTDKDLALLNSNKKIWLITSLRDPQAQPPVALASKSPFS